MLFCFCLLFSINGAYESENPARVDAEEQESKEDTTTINQKVIQSVNKGFRWLADVQNPDGSWGCDREQPESVALTSLAILALSADGNSAERGEYNTNIKNAIKWLQNYSGDSIMYAFDVCGMGSLFEHSAGVMALTQLYTSLEPQLQDNIRRRLRRSVSILTAMLKEWEDDKYSYKKIGNALMSFLALKTAYYDGFTSNIDINKTTKQINTKLIQDHDFYNLCSLLRMKHSTNLLTEEAKTDLIKKIMKIKLVSTQGGLSEWEYIGLFYASPVMSSYGNEKTLKWYRDMQELLISLQKPEGNWIIERCLSCKTFATSLALLTLLTRSQLLPIFNY